MKSLFALAATLMLVGGSAYADTTTVETKTLSTPVETQVIKEKEIVPVAVPVEVPAEPTVQSNSNSSSSSYSAKTTKQIVPAATKKTTTNKRISYKPGRTCAKTSTTTKTQPAASKVIEQTEVQSNHSENNSTSSQ